MTTSDVDSTDTTRSSAPKPPHPSLPIPVQTPVVRRTLGETGTVVAPLILGAAEFGWNVDAERSFEILDTYRALGGNAVHTSDGFSAGRSEHIVGRWIRDRGVRDEVVVTARVGAHPDNPGLDSVTLVRGVEASLNRLDVDRIDVLYLDATAARVVLEDALATAEWLVEAGKVGAIGAYGLTAAQLVEARILVSAGYPRIEVIDVPYNVLRRKEYEGDVRLVAGAQSIAVTPSHALEHGFLAGGYRQRSRIPLSARGRQLSASLTRRGTRVLRALDEIGAELGVPTAAVAIGWLLSQKSVVAPIVNAFEPQHVRELLLGTGVKLSRGQLADIARAAE